jgi:hypothetical protein
VWADGVLYGERMWGLGLDPARLPAVALNVKDGRRLPLPQGTHLTTSTVASYCKDFLAGRLLPAPAAAAAAAAAAAGSNGTCVACAPGCHGCPALHILAAAHASYCSMFVPPPHTPPPPPQTRHAGVGSMPTGATTARDAATPLEQVGGGARRSSPFCVPHSRTCAVPLPQSGSRGPWHASLAGNPGVVYGHPRVCFVSVTCGFALLSVHPQTGVREHWTAADAAVVPSVGATNFTSIVLKETQLRPPLGAALVWVEGRGRAVCVHVCCSGQVSWSVRGNVKVCRCTATFEQAQVWVCSRVGAFGLGCRCAFPWQRRGAARHVEQGLCRLHGHDAILSESCAAF